MTILSLSGIGIEFGGTVLLRDVTLTVARGERWGVVGRNGTGKSSLFRLVTGELEPTRGTVVRASGTTVAMLDQHREFPGAETVWDAASTPFADLIKLEQDLHDQGAAIGVAGETASPAMLDRYSHDLERFQHADGFTITSRIEAVLHGLGFDPAQARQQRVETLSGGERGRLGLACQLVTPADLLLLDEPTNHLDLDTTRWLEDYLTGLDAAVLLVSHDRAFLDRAADHILHIEANTATSYVGGYSSFVALRSERRLAQQRAFAKQSKVVAAEEDYIRRNIAGQDSRQAKGRRRRLSRLPRLSAPPDDLDAMAVRFNPGERGGDQVLVAENLSVEVEERTLLRHFSGIIRRGDVVGLIGPNGTGKTTLLATLLGQRDPAGGRVRMGDASRVAYYRQDLVQVPTDKTLYDVIADLRPMWTRGQIQGHLGRFDFSGDSVLRRAATLSGGERARVALAMMMLENANVLVFDEPTNHLDVESIEALEDAIDAFEGSVLLVSHDRALLRALCTRVWSLVDGHLDSYDGPFEEWEQAVADRARAASAEASKAAKLLKQNKERRAEPRVETDRRNLQSKHRTAARAVEDAERNVASAEDVVATIKRSLEDQALYQAGDGHRRAMELAQELAAAQARLTTALDVWSRAVEDLEELKLVD